jgi:hypothetical protein
VRLVFANPSLPPVDFPETESPHAAAPLTPRESRDQNPIKEIEALRNLTTAQLKEKYREVIGQETRSNRKQFLFRIVSLFDQTESRHRWSSLPFKASRPPAEFKPPTEDAPEMLPPG